MTEKKRDYRYGVLVTVIVALILCYGCAAVAYAGDQAESVQCEPVLEYELKASLIEYKIDMSMSYDAGVFFILDNGDIIAPPMVLFEAFDVGSMYVYPSDMIKGHYP